MSNRKNLTEHCNFGIRQWHKDAFKELSTKNESEWNYTETVIHTVDLFSLKQYYIFIPSLNWSIPMCFENRDCLYKFSTNGF
jgi:hypothetical protein